MIYLKNPAPDSGWVFQVNECFSEEELQVINNIVLDGNLEAAGTFQNDDVKGKDQNIRKTDIMWIPGSIKESTAIYEKLANIVKYVNDSHYNWILDYIETLQYGEYRDGGHYDFHVDSSLNMVDNDNRKLSFSILLNSPDEYEGGELEIPIPGCGKFTIEKNSALFFPSSMLHRVCPVTSGVRKSLVGWVHGPNFK